MLSESKYIINFKKYESLIIAFFANIVRYYDYALFGLSAAVLSKNFMPSGENDVQMTIFFATFSLSSSIKPFSAIIFGKIGDGSGRIASVKIASSIAAVSTGMIAFIPNFSLIGWWAVLLLTFSRMLFLISLSGEVDGIKIYVAEKVGPNRKYFVTGIVFFSSQMGVLCASIAFYLAVSYGEIEWLWRINFIVGGLLGCVVISLRKKLSESEEFLLCKEKSPLQGNLNIFNIIRFNKVKFFAATILNGTLGGMYHFLIIFFGSFKTYIVGAAEADYYGGYDNVILIGTYSIGCLIAGYLADKIKTIKQISVSLIFGIACALLMIIFPSKAYSSILPHVILVFAVPFFAVPSTIYIQSFFPIGIRMRMCGLSHSIGSVILSSTMPLVCMLIWKYTNNISLVIAYFLMHLILFFSIIIFFHKNKIA